MDVSTLMRNLKEEVTCSVCIHPYTNPKQLPCLHMFCLECLNNLTRASAHHGKIKCPICQTEVTVPATGTMETLPSCFYVKNMLDILAIKQCNTSKVTCGNCGKESEVVSYCFHCGKFWCQDCLNAHNILKENKEHRVLALKDFQDKDFEDVLKRPVFCQKELHDKEVLKFYCKVCEVPVCQTCVIVDHNKHDVEHLEITARAVKNNISAKLDATKESLRTISSYIRELQEESYLLEHRSKIHEQQIQQTVESLILTLRQKEQESLAEVGNQTKKAQECLRKQTTKFQDQLSQKKQSISQIDSLVQRSTGAELVRTKTSFDQLFYNLQAGHVVESAWKSRIIMFSKNQELTQILQESSIGNLVQSTTETRQCLVKGFQTSTAGLKTEIEVITRNSKDEQCYCRGDYITMELISSHNRNTAVELKTVDKKDGRYTISFIPSKVGQHVPTVQVNGQNVRDFPPILIKERSFTPLRCIGEGCYDNKKLEYPWGVTVNDSNEIFVSDKDNNRVVVFNETGDFVRSFGQDFLDCPNGLIADDTGCIFVGNRNGNKILLFRPSGEYATEIHKGESLSEPRGIALDAQRNLIVCDAGNKCIKLISPEGEILKTIGRERFQMPTDCLYHEEKIFVSDCNAHLISVFQSNGEFLYEFGRYGTGDEELNKPAGLAVDKAGQLLVCSFDNHRVQVFTLDGTFVTKFGEYGKNVGEIDSPSSVCVLKSGHIVVCEMGNFRLQIYE